MPTTTPSQPPSSPTTKENRTLYCFILTSIFSLAFIFFHYSSTNHSSSLPFSIPRNPQRNFIFKNNPNHPNSNSTTPSLPQPPRLAYFITASNGEITRILRLLFAIYHPRNYYLLHLDLTSPQSQRDYLATWIESHAIFGLLGPFHNVYVVGKADFAYPNAPSSVASILHGASLLLSWSHWHWFISLSASDYPLVPQDDLLHILSYLPKDINFINHSSEFSPRETRRMKMISVDPGLYLNEKTEMFYATQRRELPNAFRLFTGSGSAILSHEFVEFCVGGTDNLPRTVLMYLSNVPSAQANYFPTVLCNTREFKKTVINHSLHFASWDGSPKRKRRELGLEDLSNMIESGSAFASNIAADDPVLDLIDQKLLDRKPGSIVPGGWCLGETDADSCTIWGDTKILRPGPGARRIEKQLVELLSNGTLSSQQCALQ